MKSISSQISVSPISYTKKFNTLITLRFETQLSICIFKEKVGTPNEDWSKIQWVKHATQQMIRGFFYISNECLLIPDNTI